MTFNPNIPLPGDLLSNSQLDLKNNFSASNTSFGVNHYPFSDLTANNGKHKFVELPVQSLPATLAGEATLWANTAGQSQLFFTADAGAKSYQLTRAIDASFTRFAANSAYQASGGGNAAVTGGWTFLPGGMLLNYGAATTLNPGGSITVKFAVAFASSSFYVVVTPRTTSSIGGGNHDWDVGSFTTTGFDLAINGNYNSGDTFYFHAIGL